MNRNLFLATLALLACSANVDSTSIGHEPVAYTVVIEGMQFKPPTLTIGPGDSVTWVNRDIVDHTVTTATSATPRFDSQDIGVGKSWQYTFTKRGTYEYLCRYHPTMKAAIEVTTR